MNERPFNVKLRPELESLLEMFDTDFKACDPTPQEYLAIAGAIMEAALNNVVDPDKRMECWMITVTKMHAILTGGQS